jgi:hypothetical protein
MRRCRRPAFLALLAGLGALTAPLTARANPWDISLRGLGRYDPADPSSLLRYQRLSGEIALALSPKPLAPASTPGVSGFEFSLANTFTGISNKADYWQGQPGTPVMEAPLHNRQVPGALWTPTLHIRKGLPFSTEVGVQGTYLAFSNIFMLGGEVKVALHESFFPWMPALAVRLAVGRLFGASDLDLLTAEGDVVASYGFAVGGMAKVTPYLGYGQLGAQVSTSVLDLTPYVTTDNAGGPGGSLYTFPTLNWKDNRFSRYFGGIRVNSAMIELLYELNVGIMSYGHSTKSIMSHTLTLGFDV